MRAIPSLQPGDTQDTMRRAINALIERTGGVVGGGKAPMFADLAHFADDAAAAAGDVPVGGLYRTGSAIKVRVA